ncbi:MAG TPA: SMC-Scp complex subunit ScpB [Gammaproteobacteria bacterium]|nr:SMC-Scp complex subunit ScpB [Gammaproteobacteria bacterium]HDH16327.1 SMC-Scp complex subunit ScpB [Gammaproteobacteria bacterium]HDZ78644.1 SMC-Scp complex subunit ScpB [Gammaproteobacteria bacterium]
MSANDESRFSSDQPDELKNIIEAAIMVSEVPITVDRILGMFLDATKPERATVKELLLELEQDYAKRGFELRCIDKGYRLQTREEYSPWLARLSTGRQPRYSRAMLETLAIIAYRQPVTRGEIEEIRGVAVSTDIIRTLQEREWIRQLGVRDVPGKPALFGTTKNFLEYFSLEGLSQLPTLQDIRDMDTIAAELNMELPLEDNAVDRPDDKIDNEAKSAAEKNSQADMLENLPVTDDRQPVENASSNDENLVTTDDSSENEESPVKKINETDSNQKKSG